MPFLFRDLSVLSYANGFTLWHYTTKDGLHDVLKPDYFAPSKAMLRRGDHMHINGGDFS